MQGAEGSSSHNPIVAAILAGSAPRPLKLSAARGVLPLGRSELLRILVALVSDDDEQLRAEASARLSAFPELEILPLLEDSTAAPEVLDHFGCATPGRASFKAAVISNPATLADTLRRMAPSLAGSQIDHLLLNQTRLISTPDLLDLLEVNTALTPLQRSRVDEIRLHFLTAAPVAAKPGTAMPSAPTPTTTAPLPEVGPEEVEEAAPADAEEAGLIANATSKILRMNVAEKIQLAMKGTREERGILIRDSSRSVQESVMDSPKLTDQEVENFARMRSISDDVLRIIAANRDWVKNYAVIHALAGNPKTPVGIAMNMVSRLTNRDLKILAGDKNVTEVIRRHASKLSQSRLKRPGPH